MVCGLILNYIESKVFSSLTEDKLLVLTQGDDEHKNLTSKNYEEEVPSSAKFLS